MAGLMVGKGVKGSFHSTAELNFDYHRQMQLVIRMRFESARKSSDHHLLILLVPIINSSKRKLFEMFKSDQETN